MVWTSLPLWGDDNTNNNGEPNAAATSSGGEGSQPSASELPTTTAGASGTAAAGGLRPSSASQSTTTTTASTSPRESAAVAAAAGALADGVKRTAIGVVEHVKETVKGTIDETNDFESEILAEEEAQAQGGEGPFSGRSGGVHSSLGSRYTNPNNNRKVKFHVETYLVDHHSLIVPSSTVRFRPGTSPMTGGKRTSIMSNNDNINSSVFKNNFNHPAIMNSIVEEDGETEQQQQQQGEEGSKTMKPTSKRSVVVSTDSVEVEAPRSTAAANGATTTADATSAATASSSTTFHTASRVIEDPSTQIILEERYDTSTNSRKVIVKRVNTGSKGLQFLRVIYTLVCALWLGIFFAITVQMLLNMVLDLSVVSGQTSISGNLVVWKAIGVILGMIQLCVALAEGLVIGTRFVLDAWGGHYVIRELFFLRKDLVFVDWMYFWFVLGIPVFILIGTLFAKSDKFWEITGLAWMGSLTALFLLFCTYSIFYELRGALNFVRNDLERKRSSNNNNNTDQSNDVDHYTNQHRAPSIRDMTASLNSQSPFSFWYVLKSAIVMRQTRRYSGKEKHRFYATSLVPSNDRTSVTDEDMVVQNADIVGSSFVRRVALFSRLSQTKFFTQTVPICTKLDTPRKLFSLEDAQGTRPFLTKWTWSLERLFCTGHSSVAIIDGPGALTRRQIQSMLSCNILGMVMIALLIISVLTWLDFGPGMIAILSVVIFIVVGMKSLQVYRAAKLIFSLKDHRESQKRDEESGMDNDKSENDNSDDKYKVERNKDRRAWVNRNASKNIKGINLGIYVIQSYHRISEAKPWFGWTMMFIELFLFVLWPTVALFTMYDYVVSSLFIVIAIISCIRHYVNLLSVIQETGRLDLTATGKTKTERWAHMSRLTTILNTVSADKVKWVWTAVLAFFCFAFVFLFFGGVITDGGAESTSTQKLTFLPPEFSYLPLPNDIRYPTCTLAKAEQFHIDDGQLYDFAFLSSLTYRTDEVVDQQLSEYFSNDPRLLNVTDERDYVSSWRNATGRSSIPVKFNLFRFSTQSGTVGIIAIRGSAKPWDWLVNNQLWQAAMLVQAVRAILPIGDVFTPYLDRLVTLINSLQSSLIREVSYYTTVTPFTEFVKNDPTYGSVILTGHSLGGGIAIISSAQSKTPAIAISGPNARLSHGSFDPPFPQSALDQYTFNVVPARDMVPRFDDLAQNYQNIRCLGPLNSPFECHNNIRAICELMYNCGSEDRLVPCECHTEFGYDQPQNNGTLSFEDLCRDSGSSAQGWRQ